MAASLRYRLPDDDICRFLLGSWKRNLEWREFGPGFQHVRTSNSLVAVEPCKDAAVEPDTRILDWRFGSDLDEMKLGFSMQFFPPQEDGEVAVEWSYKGRVCHGDFSPAAAVLSLAFRDDEGVVSNATYRAVDANTMAVCIAEVDSRHTPVIQYGYMCRLCGEETAGPADSP
ncbi:unnamed protein product [Scytosiphon promiscuus]